MAKILEKIKQLQSMQAENIKLHQFINFVCFFSSCLWFSPALIEFEIEKQLQWPNRRMCL